MKFLPVVVLVGLVCAQDQAHQQQENGGSELAECGNKFSEKVQALCGTFLDKDEIMDVSFGDCFCYKSFFCWLIGRLLESKKTQTIFFQLLHQSFELYFKQGKTVKEIQDYYFSNYRNIGLDPDQVDKVRV
jgi:hypothetical protein